MRDTFNEFVKFISDDPVMLGLCCAIAFLVVVFIFVLIFGGRKKNKKEVVDVVEDNTGALLQVNTNDEPLRSTQEFALNDLQVEKTNIEVNNETMPQPEVPEDIIEKTAPISIEEALVMRNQEENVVVPNDAVEIPVEIETPVLPEVEFTEVEPKVNIENTVNQPFSSVYVNNGDEMPKVNEDEFSRTAIIKHIPKQEEYAEPMSANSEDELDDIELPKLKGNNDNSILNTLKPESCQIK